jgi:hypothetical protein
MSKKDLNINDLESVSDEDLQFAKDNALITVERWREEYERRNDVTVDPETGEPFAASAEAAEEDSVPSWNKSMNKGELADVLRARGYEVDEASTKDVLIEALEKDDAEQAEA